MFTKTRLGAQLAAATAALTMMLSCAHAQKGPPGGYSEDYRVHALWQPIGEASAARTVQPGRETTRIKVCIAYRRANYSIGRGAAAPRVFLAETENGTIVRPLSESVFPDVAHRTGRYSAAAPFWCFFSDRERPPAGIVVAEGRTIYDAVPMLYDTGTSQIEFEEKGADADLNRLMLDWVRRK